MTDYQPASTDDDLLPIVDAQDNVIGALPRRQVHLEGHLHRAVHVIVLDPEGRIWLQQRAAAKDTFPGFWDLSATGHVDPGESYAEAARRELREELGLEAEPVYLETIPASARTTWEFHALFWLRHAGPLDAFCRAEIQALRRFTLEEIRAALAAADSPWPLTPGVEDALPALARILAS